MLKDFKYFKVHGLIGGRLDHQLAILGEVHHFLKMPPDKVFNFEDKILATNKKSFSFLSHHNFSLFSLEKNKFNISGEVKYPLKEKVVFPLSSLTLSNIGIGNVLIEAEKPFFIILNDSTNPE